MMGRIGLRLLPIGLLWLGILLLRFKDIPVERLFRLALIFSALILMGALCERIVRYKGDPLILPIVQTIMVLGLVFLIRINPEIAERQFWWANMGLALYYAVQWGLRDYRRLGRFQYLWGLVAVGLLLVTLFFGFAAGGAKSWLRIGGLGFEPEELVKLALLLFLSSYLTEHEQLLRIGTVQLGRFSLPDWRTLGPFLIMAAFSLGLLAAQKSLGTALVFYLLFVLIIYAATERPLYLGISIPVLVGTGLLGYILFGHVRVRIETWLNPWQDATGGGYQIAQSLFAISGGKILGTGLGNGIGAFMVPAASTDFIFSVIAEELGFAGAMAVIALFLLLVSRTFAVSLKAIDRYGQILAAGIGILLGIETLIILSGVTKLFPLTGIPLPWVSYGGSSLIVHCLLLGVLANISNVTAASSVMAKNKGREYAT